MPTTSPGSDQPIDVRQAKVAWIDAAAKLSATAILIIYVAGFLVVSLHNASYGIIQHDLVRPRLLATGVLFFFFLALGIFAGAVTFRVFFFEEDEAAVASKHTLYFYIMRCLKLLLIAITGTLSLTWFFKTEHTPVYFYLTLIVVGALYLFGFYVRSYWLDKWPKLVSSFFVLLLIGALFALGKITPPSYLFRIIWIFGLGVLTPALARFLADPMRLLEHNWSQWIGGIFSVIVFFAFLLYPKIEGSLGGGLPLPVVLQFKDKSPLDPTQTRSFGWILDESDAGFYLLKNDQDKDAIFVPRTDVSLIFYGDPERIKKLIKP